MKYSKHNMYFLINKKEEPVLFSKMIKFIKNKKIKNSQSLTEREKEYLKNLLSFEVEGMEKQNINESFFEYRAAKKIIELIKNGRL